MKKKRKRKLRKPRRLFTAREVKAIGETMRRRAQYDLFLSSVFSAAGGALGGPLAAFLWGTRLTGAPAPKEKQTMEIKIFGSRLLVRLLIETDRDPMHSRAFGYAEPKRPAGYGGIDEYRYAKGRVVSIGSDAPAAPAGDPFAESLIDDSAPESGGRLFSAGGPFDGFLAQFGDLITKIMRGGLVEGAIPAGLAFGDVVIFSVGMAALLPGESDLVIVPGGAVVAVVTERDHAPRHETPAPHLFEVQTYGSPLCGRHGCGRESSDLIHDITRAPGGEGVTDGQ